MPRKRGLRLLKTVTKTARAAARPNPPFWASAFYEVAPAVATYAVTRVAGRVARTYLGQRFPKTRPFLPIAGSLMAAGLMYYAASAVPALKKYKTAVLVGAGIALTQSLLLAVAPQLAWLFDLPTPRKALPAPAASTALVSSSDAALDQLEAQVTASSPAGVDDLAAEELAGDDGELAAGWESPLVN